MDKTTPAVAAYIKQQMKHSGHSENSLAEAAGIPRTTLRRRLIDPNELTAEEIMRIAVCVGTKPSRIWDHFDADQAVAA